jgi:hypothetical protein
MPNGTDQGSTGGPAAQRRTLSARLSLEQAAWIHSHCQGATTVSLFLRQLVQQAMERERSEVRRIQARLAATSEPERS